MRKDALSLLRFLQICIHSSASVWFKCVCSVCLQRSRRLSTVCKRIVCCCCCVCACVCWCVCMRITQFKLPGSIHMLKRVQLPPSFLWLFPPNLFLPNNVYILISCGTQIWASCLVMHNWLGIKYVRAREKMSVDESIWIFIVIKCLWKKDVKGFP